jgi:hypothetical protein
LAAPSCLGNLDHQRNRFYYPQVSAKVTVATCVCACCSFVSPLRLGKIQDRLVSRSVMTVVQAVHPGG